MQYNQSILSLSDLILIIYFLTVAFIDMSLVFVNILTHVVSSPIATIGQLMLVLILASATYVATKNNAQA